MPWAITVNFCPRSKVCLLFMTKAETRCGRWVVGRATPRASQTPWPRRHERLGRVPGFPGSLEGVDHSSGDDHELVGSTRPPSLPGIPVCECPTGRDNSGRKVRGLGGCPIRASLLRPALGLALPPPPGAWCSSFQSDWGRPLFRQTPGPWTQGTFLLLCLAAPFP